MSKIAQFESDSSQASEDAALQSYENLQSFVLWWGGGGKFLPPTIQTSVKFCDFEMLNLC